MIQSTYTVYDIETSPRPEAELLDMLPDFQAPANYTNSDKIREAITAKKKSWMDDAALEADTGTIVTIGMSDDGRIIVPETSEPELIAMFFDHITAKKESSAGLVQFIGFDSNRFDINFILRRAMILGIKIPKWIRAGRFLHESFVDLLDVWRMGDRQTSIGLNALSKAFGLPGKLGSGKGFHLVWNSDRAKAVEYATRDVWLTEQLAIRMSIITKRNTEQEELPL